MTKQLSFILGGILLLGAHTSRSQNTFSSPYSVYGIGLMNSRTSSFNRSMGGTGIGLQDAFSLNHVNPASYSSISSSITHIYEIGFYTESNRYQTSSLSESKTNGGITNLNYWFRLRPRWATTVGLTPFSSVSYSIATEKDLATSSSASYLYEGSGNITQLYLGNGFDITKNLSVGVNIAYLFGSISKTESLFSSSTSSALTLENKIFTNKVNLDFGIQYKIKLKNKTLIIGAVADDGLTLKGSEKSTLFDENSDTLNISTGNDKEYNLPAYAGIGLSLQTKRFTHAVDLKYEDWTSAHFADQEVAFQDTWKLSAGSVYKGNPEANHYFGLMSVRAGFYFQNYYLTLNKTTLPNWGLSAGISLPVFDNRSSINLTYNYDQLGTVSNDLIKQQSNKIMFDLVIRDLWGIKRKFD
jgi:hypothetical protein